MKTVFKIIRDNGQVVELTASERVDGVLIIDPSDGVRWGSHKVGPTHWVMEVRDVPRPKRTRVRPLPNNITQIG